MTIKLYNTLTRQKEEFVPIKPGAVSMYACGPTVYNYAHIGNGRMAVIFDVLYRLLKTQYASVLYASNITDVEDKIMDAAKQSGEPIDAITQKFTKIYNDDMQALGNLLPDIQPKATDHIGDMISIIERLIERGNAYAVDHGVGLGQTVLFHVPSYPDYGALSGRSRDDQIAGARVEVAPYKRDPADFVLWKPSTDDQPGWASPWGRGRPGWHIECSAMSARHLGLPFDIHGGGADLKFPHHENEIAQSCCAVPGHDHPAAPNAFARYWVHNGFVTVQGEKMSKSLGNVTLPHDLLEHGIPGEVLRWALLSSHYRAPLDWSEQKMTEARKHVDAFYDVFKKAQNIGIVLDHTKGKIDPDVLSALEDDLNTPLAQTRLIHMQKIISASDTLDTHEVQNLFTSLRVMGFLGQDPQRWGRGMNGDDLDVDVSWIQERLSARDGAKRDKNFALSDQIRAELLDRGIVVKDTPDGPVWMKK